MRPVPVFHRAVVLEKGDVVGDALDAGDQPELVVELNRGPAHGVLDPRALDPGGEVVAHFVPVRPGELAAQEGDHVIRLHAVDRGVRQGVVQGLELGLAVEDHIGGVLHLHAAPVDAGGELGEHRAVGRGQAVEVPVEPGDIPRIGERLGPRPVGDLGKGLSSSVYAIPVRWSWRASTWCPLQ